MKLLTAGQMQEVDHRAMTDGGIPGLALMEAAGLTVVDSLCRHFGPLFPGPIWVLCGRGNNGGDGLVIARALSQRGWRVRTLLLAPAEAVAGDAAVNLNRLSQLRTDLRVCPDADILTAALAGGPPAVVVDALFGTGLSKPPRGHYAVAIDWLNRQAVPVIAVDVPSGVDASSGRIHAPAVRATLTVTFAAAKPGLVCYPGAEAVGRLEVADIGIPARLLAEAGGDHWLVQPALAQRLLPPRPVSGHKGLFGHLLTVAGSRGKTGAAALCAEAGLRAGAGLVTLACPESCWDVLAGKLTEVMTEGLADEAGRFAAGSGERLRQLWPERQAVVVGPGLGTAAGTAEMVASLWRECSLPLVVDADGLNLLAQNPAWLARRACPEPVLTPHPGEMARLLGCTVAEVQAGRLDAAREFACRHEVVLVLKGARTVTADPRGRLFINDSGNPALAVAGTGDVLAGLIGGLLAQGLPPCDAAVLAVYWHGLAADRLARRQGEAGLLARELSAELPATRNSLQQGEELC